MNSIQCSLNIHHFCTFEMFQTYIIHSINNKKYFRQWIPKNPSVSIFHSGGTYPPPPPSTTAALDSSLRCLDHILLGPTLIYHYIAPTSWIVFQVPSPLATRPSNGSHLWSLLHFAPTEEYPSVNIQPKVKLYLNLTLPSGTDNK